MRQHLKISGLMGDLLDFSNWLIDNHIPILEIRMGNDKKWYAGRKLCRDRKAKYCEKLGGARGTWPARYVETVVMWREDHLVLAMIAFSGRIRFEFVLDDKG